MNQQPQAAVDGSDIQVNVTNPANSPLVISYQAQASATPGPRNLSITTPYGTATTTIHVYPSVTISGDIGVAAGGSTDYGIQLSSSSSSEPITLALSTVSGTGSATFSDGTTSMTITDNQTVTVMGVAVSSDADNIQLVAKPQRNQGKTLAQQKLSTVTVSLSLRSTGDSLSDDNHGKYYWNMNYLNEIGSNRLGQMVIDTLGSFWCGIGTEIIGTVTPSNYTGIITLRRYNVGGSEYKGSAFLKAVGGNDDTSSDPFLDTDPQSGGSAGKVYDLDAPGINSTAGLTYRMRDNFQAYAVLGQVNRSVPDERQSKRRVGEILPYYARVSCMGGSTDFQLAFATDITGDNKVDVGTTNTNYNLKN